VQFGDQFYCVILAESFLFHQIQVVKVLLASVAYTGQFSAEQKYKI